MKQDYESEFERVGTDMQDEIDTELAANVPKGTFTKAALNRLVEAHNAVLKAMGLPANYPKFTEDQTEFPIEFVRGLAMVSDAADQSGAAVSITLDGIKEDRDVAMLAAKLMALSRDTEFKKAMGESAKEAEFSVKVETKPAGRGMGRGPKGPPVDSEKLMMERA